MSNQNILDSKLSKNEQKELRILNKKSNSLRKRIKKNQDPLNMSIREFMRNWADTNIHVMIDFTNFIQEKIVIMKLTCTYVNLEQIEILF